MKTNQYLPSKKKELKMLLLLIESLILTIPPLLAILLIDRRGRTVGQALDQEVIPWIEAQQNH